MPRQRMKRENLGPGEILCTYCTAKCCRYFALPIETPTTREDFDHLRWYMMHGPVSVFVDGETWFLMVQGDCKHLQANNRCGNPDDRPRICRSYSTDNCEYENDGCYDKLFESPEQIWEYAEAVLPRPRRRKTNRPIMLPVITLN